MLAYAAHRPVPARRQSSPPALLLVISAHIALIAGVMSAKIDLPGRFQHGPPLIPIRLLPPPPPLPHASPAARFERKHATVPIEKPRPAVDTRPLGPQGDVVDPSQGEPAISPGNATVGPSPREPATTVPIRQGPRLLTPPSELRPTYPASKLASEEEAVLKLRVTIDDRGRVIAVDPVGYADPTFLDSARRYMLVHWRYDPATEEGQPVFATIIVTLRFQLDG